MSGDERMPMGAIRVECRQPFDFELSLRAARSFGLTAAQVAAIRQTGTRQAGEVRTEASLEMRLGVWLDDRPTLLEIRADKSHPGVIQAEARPVPASRSALHALAARVVNAALELQPFYDQAAGHPVLGRVTRSLHGLKAFRPSGLFDMLVTAIIEQQISLLAARSIRSRLIAGFGAEVEGEPVFPAPSTLAEASLDELTACGLSRRKAEYVSGLAREVSAGSLDLQALETAPSDTVRERVVSLRGFGPWSAEYVLIRGLARPDAVPVDDLGIRTVVGRLLGNGDRPTPAQVAALLAPLAPFRGLAAFYLLVAARLL
jgi:DNA-3-methyladenine glycosylase II